MNSIALYFASGESFYLGATLLLLTVCISPYARRRWAASCRNIAALLALALMVMACPPFPWGVYALFAAFFVAWFIVANWSAESSTISRLRIAIAAILIGALMVMSASELSRRSIPNVSGIPADHVAVIGDSISSGIDPRVPAWPVVMEKTTGVRVKNLARPGATTTEGVEIAGKLSPDDTLVILEIGGNDLLSGTSAAQFEKALDALLARATASKRTVVMLELPLFPTKVAYGRIQRRLAAKYGVWLIPKRYLTEILGTKDATADGIHLASRGTQMMADLVHRTISPVLVERTRR